MRNLAAGVWMCGLVMMGGCSRTSAYRDVLSEQTSAFNETADILKTVTNEASMEAARAKLTELEIRFASISARAKGLGPPTEDVREALRDDYSGLELALTRLRSEVSRVRSLPGGAAFLENLSFGKATR